MNPPIHPSPEELSSYFDQELSTSDREPIESHLAGCSSCQDELKAFGVLSEMGPRVEESLPGDAYWSDLPSRILARIQQDAAPRPSVVRPRSAGWSWLWSPQGIWRYVVGTAVSFGLVAGLWLVLSEQQLPGNPTDLAQDVSPAPDRNLFSDAGTSGPTLSPNSYTRRVVQTYGSRDDLGTSLDFDPVSRQQADPNRPRPVRGTQVTQRTPTLQPDMRQFTDGVVSYGCGAEDPVEAAYIAALVAEAAGDYRMAIQGYNVIRANVPQGRALHHEAQYRLNYLAWEQKLRAQGFHRSTMAELNNLANKAYQTWLQTQQNRDCQEAWCMNRILLKLDSELAEAQQAKLRLSRVNQLKNCVE